MRTTKWELIHVDQVERVWMIEGHREDGEEFIDFMNALFGEFRDHEVHMRNQSYGFVLKREKVKQGDFKNKPASPKKHK